MRSLEGAYSGETAYIIGNGPSLREWDLSKLDGKLTFGVNDGPRLYKHRPEFWVVLDAWYTHYYWDILNSYNGSLILNASNLAVTAHVPSNYIKGAYYSPAVSLYYNSGIRMAGFSPESDIETIANGDVSLACLQLAWYMGAREFVLLGIDQNLMAFETTGEHFSDQYCDRKPNLRIARDGNIVEKGWKVAREFILSNGGEVYNTNPLGNLTIFPYRSQDEVT